MKSNSNIDMIKEMIVSEKARLYSDLPSEQYGAADMLIAERWAYYEETKPARSEISSEEREFIILLRECIEAMSQHKIDYMVGIAAIAHDVINGFIGN